MLAASSVHFAPVGNAGYVDSFCSVVNLIDGQVIPDADAPFVFTALQFLAARGRGTIAKPSKRGTMRAITLAGRAFNSFSALVVSETW